MEVSKIQLSPAERELIKNAEIILTKNRVLEKVKALLEEVQAQQLLFVSANGLATPIFTVSPKISKGENYMGLPYLILDYPRHSSGKEFFFIRTMFWWGKFFSSTLQLSGGCKEQFTDHVVNNYDLLKNFFVSISDDPWAHHLETQDFRPLSSLSKNEFAVIAESFDHIKIAARYELSDWETMPLKLYENWRLLLNVCGLIA